MRSRQAVPAVAVGLMALLAAATAISAADTPMPTQIHEWAAPAVVRVVSGHTARWRWRGKYYDVQVALTGSGFFVDHRGYIVTNAHVVRPTREGDAAALDALLAEVADEVTREAKRTPSAKERDRIVPRLREEASLLDQQRLNYVVLQSGKQLRYEIKAYGAPLREGQDLVIGKDVAVLKVETRNAPVLEFADSDPVPVASNVFVIGYPGAADLGDIGQAAESLEPTATQGSISARKSSADGVALLQTDAAISGGNSGGPALDEGGKVIGLATFGATETQGFNFLIPSNTAAEFLRQAGAEGQRSATDRLWREGLGARDAGDLQLAKERFSEVLALFPDHTDARQRLSQTQEQLLTTPASRSRQAATVAVIVAALLGVVSWRWRARRNTRLGAPNGKRTEVFVGSATGSLACTAGPHAGRTFLIGTGLTIGRDASCDIVVDDSQVSGQHVWIGPVDGRVVVRDRKSTNGTFLNEDRSLRITDTVLNHGDTVVLGGAGRVRFRYSAEQAG